MPEQIRDNTNYWTDLAFMGKDYKNELWISQSLYYAKQNGNSVKLVDTDKKIKYRNLEKGVINKQEYREIIDPKVAGDNESGRADYFSSNFEDNPISQHLDNILRAKLEKIGIENQLQVNTIDKFSVSQKQRDKSRILYQREFRKVINDNLELLGLPKMKESENPFAYVKSLQGSDASKMITSVDTLLDYVKSQIRDEHDLVLYESYIYKGEIEVAFQLGIQHYLINLNKWVEEKADWFNTDIKNFNKACGRVYTDDTTGRMTVDYIEPDQLFTSPFKRRNGEDILYWFYEFDKPFADFVREFGTKLTEAQLKEVFELNKQFGGAHGMNWNKAGSYKGSNAKIRIGIFSVLTQDADKFSEKNVSSSTSAFKTRPLDWLPHKNTPDAYKETPETRIYNVWYSCYYIPPPGERLSSNSQVDWAWQSQYIFKRKKDIDMYRYGVDARYAKSTLVIWKDESRMSFTDIKEAYMPEIRTAWHRFQNALVSDVTGTLVGHDLMLGMLNAVDEANKKTTGSPEKPTGGNGYDAGLKAWRMFRQSGMGFYSFKDSKGNLILEPQKLFIDYSNHQLDNAEKYLKVILDLYNVMSIALAQNNISEGQNPKTHTAVSGIQESMKASENGIWFVEKPCREFLVMFGERTVQFILCMVKERKKYGFSKRFDEFSSVIGLANSMMLESVEDLQPEEIGLTVTIENVESLKDYYFNITNQMLRDGKIGFEDVEMIISTIQHDYKYGSFLLNLAAKRQQRELANKEELQFKREQALKDKDLQIAMAGIRAKAQGKDSNIEKQGEVDAKLAQLENQLKSITLSMQKEQLKNNRLEQDNNKSRLEREKETFDDLAPTG
jgi:hypothetical protein